MLDRALKMARHNPSPHTRQDSRRAEIPVDRERLHDRENRAQDNVYAPCKWSAVDVHAGNRIMAAIRLLRGDPWKATHDLPQ